MRKVAVAVGLMLLGVGTSETPAEAVLFTFSSGTLSASADFTQVGDDLIVSLTNTSLSDVLVPANVLTAVFFTLAGDPALTPISAVLGPGSVVLFAPSVAGQGPAVGGEWAYNDGLSGAPGGADEGISSAGFGLFGPSNLFPPGVNLQGPASPNGIEYGITSAGDNPATGNAAVTGDNALIKNQVIFTLDLPDDFTLGAITNVSFQYGTDLTEPNVPDTAIPEPGTLLLLGSGLAGLGALGRRRLLKRRDS